LSSALGTGSFADVVRLLILTGARRNEIGLLKWSEIDLARKMIVLPPNRVKNDREHSLPLSSQALGIIERLPIRGKSGLSGGSSWRELARASENTTNFRQSCRPNS